MFYLLSCFVISNFVKYLVITLALKVSQNDRRCADIKNKYEFHCRVELWGAPLCSVSACFCWQLAYLPLISFTFLHKWHPAGDESIYYINLRSNTFTANDIWCGVVWCEVVVAIVGRWPSLRTQPQRHLCSKCFHPQIYVVNAFVPSGMPIM